MERPDRPVTGAAGVSDADPEPGLQFEREDVGAEPVRAATGERAQPSVVLEAGDGHVQHRRAQVLRVRGSTRLVVRRQGLRQ